MSIFHAHTITCPACKHVFEMQASDSINADRRPDLRDAILERSFQREACPSCGEVFRLDPLLTYIDVERGQWLAAQPLEALPEWGAEQADALALFQQAYGQGAPAAAREIGELLTVRLVFGWAALREKLVIREAGLDDATVELLKLALIRSLSPCPLGPGVELRLESLTDDMLRFHWVKAGTEQIVEELEAPRALYDEIVSGSADWAELRDVLIQGPFVDAQKTWLALS
jgi:CpXC protein